LPVDGGASELVAAVSGVPVRPGTFLKDPQGVTHPVTSLTSTHGVYRVAAPRPGNWSLEVLLPPCQEGGCPFVDYLVEASLKSVLHMEVAAGTAVLDRIQGGGVPIVVTLTAGIPIPGADVQVLVELPSGGTVSFPMLDDGRHGDGKADDGIYA